MTKAKQIREDRIKNMSKEQAAKMIEIWREKGVIDDKEYDHLLILGEI